MMTRNEKKEEEEVESQPDNWLLNLVLFLLLSLLLSSFLWLYLWFERRLFFGRRSLVANQARGERVLNEVQGFFLPLCICYAVWSLLNVVCALSFLERRSGERNTRRKPGLLLYNKRERETELHQSV